MPMRPQRPCRRCYALQIPGSPFCAQHQQAVGWESHQRGRTSSQRGYGAPWRRIRARVLSEEKVCRVCAEQGYTTAASMVDHIIPKAAGGTDARVNLRAICAPCHAHKTGRDRFAVKPAYRENFR